MNNNFADQLAKVGERIGNSKERQERSHCSVVVATFVRGDHRSDYRRE